MTMNKPFLIVGLCCLSLYQGWEAKRPEPPTAMAKVDSSKALLTSDVWGQTRGAFGVADSQTHYNPTGTHIKVDYIRLVEVDSMNPEPSGAFVKTLFQYPRVGNLGDSTLQKSLNDYLESLVSVGERTIGAKGVSVRQATQQDDSEANFQECVVVTLVSGPMLRAW